MRNEKAAKSTHKHGIEDTKQICPMCNSDNIVLWLGGTTGTYRCTDCGYVGPLVIETELGK